MVHRASAQGPLCDQSDASLCSSDNSFCLQMQVKYTQAETISTTTSSHKFSIQAKPSEKEYKIFKSKNRYLCRGQYHTTKCVQVDF